MKQEGKLSDTMGTVLAIFDIVTDEIASNLRSAGNTVENELAIKRKQTEKERLIHQLGNSVYETGKIDTDIIDELRMVDKEIKSLEGNRPKPKGRPTEEE